MNNAMTATADRTPDLDLDAANRQLAGMTAEGRILWAINLFGSSAVLLSSMQKTSSVLHYFFHRNRLENEILFVDTQYHFRETLQLRDLFIRRFRLNIVTLYPGISPERQEEEEKRKLYRCEDGQPLCCKLRKEKPFLDYMKAEGKRLVIGGLRRDEGGRRKELNFIAPDPRIDGYRLYPLADWTDAMVDELLAETGFPVHPLHAQRYPSIGCECCTTPVAAHESPRAGRWRHLRRPDAQPAYCGINYNEGGGI